MGTYRVSRPLSAPSLLLDTSPGVSDEGALVSVLRFKEPWAQGTGFLDRFASWQRGWHGLGKVDGLVPFVEAGQAGQTPCVVQAFEEREALRAALRGPGAFSPVESVALVLQVARGLAALERAGLNHGDVSCSSILVGRDGHARLEAVGMAAATLPDTGLGPARSELLFLSPEEASGPRGARSDVFRLGLVLLELITGKGPFTAGTWPEVKARYENFPQVVPGHFASAPGRLAALLASMLARSPDARPSPAALEAQLAEAYAELGGQSPQQQLAQAFARLFPNRPSTPVGQTGVILTVSTPSVKLARIGTKRVTAEEMAAVQAQEADAAAKALGREWTQRHARDGGNPKDFLLGAVLLEQQKVSVAALDEALQQAQSLGGTLFEALISSGACDEDVLLPLAATQLKQACLTGRQLLELPLGQAQAALLPRDVAEDWTVLPLRAEAGGLVLAMVDPSRLEVLEDVKRRGRLRSISPVRATERTLREGFARVYDGKTSPPEWAPASRHAPAPAMDGGFELDVGAVGGGAPASGGFELDGSSPSLPGSLGGYELEDGPLLAPAPHGIVSSPYTQALLGGPSPSAPRFNDAQRGPSPSAPRFDETQRGPSPSAPRFDEAQRAPSPSAPRFNDAAPSAPRFAAPITAPSRTGAPPPSTVRSAPLIPPVADEPLEPPRPSPSAPRAPAPSAPRPAPPLETTAPPPSAPRTEAALAGSLDVALRLFDALLAMNGERGLEASAMIALVRSVAKQAGASGAPLDQVRLSVTAVCAGALLEGKRAFEVPSRPSVAAALGPHWAGFEDFIRPLLDGTELPKDPRGVVISLCFEVAQEVGGVPKNLAEASPVLDRLRARYPLPALAALEIVLASS